MESARTPVDLTMFSMQLADDDDSHCEAELGTNRPMSHWKTHCVNCGSHMSKAHRRSDCPPQNYERGN